MSQDDETFVRAAALAALVLGVSLLVAPQGVSAVVGVAPDRRMARTLGVVDLVLAAGLWGGRPRWAWVAARAASDPIIAAAVMAKARSRRARVLAAALLVGGPVSAHVAARMRRGGR